MYIISKYLGIYAILHVYLTKTYKSSYLIAISNCYLHQKKKKPNCRYDRLAT
ncbi:putative ribonuclease A-like domain superfamily [Helianthus anomalus]